MRPAAHPEDVLHAFAPEAADQQVGAGRDHEASRLSRRTAATGRSFETRPPAPGA